MRHHLELKRIYPLKSLLLNNLEMGIIIVIKHSYGTCYLLVCTIRQYEVG